MNILILGLNYAPEQVGIGPYTAGMANFLAKAGHRVSVVCGKPYYPQWEVDSAYRGGGVHRSVENGLSIARCPIYVPRNPSGAKRLLHHASFAAAAFPMMIGEARRMKPDVVMAIAPSLIAVPAARAAARVAGAKLWLHIQDFEMDAAFATGLLKSEGVGARLARGFEDWGLVADKVSSISPQMCARLVEKGVAADRVVEFRNWANMDEIHPLDGPSPYRVEWAIDRRHVALYSGNIANKQGIEIILEAARLLATRKDLLFAICGNGVNRKRLIAQAAGLDNIRFFDLQPTERLSAMLGLASVHLLPQIAGAADLVLPSKLSNMLASGRPVVATAGAGTGLANEVDGCGLVVQPGDASAFATAIDRLLDDLGARASFGTEARRRAEERWSKDAILARFEAQLIACATQDNAERATVTTA
jgi:colanic acid biosynthesis glycosyl transferase WcaI